MKELDNIEKNVKKLDDNLNNTVIEILKDTIKDCTKHNSKLFHICIFELIVIIITIVVSLVIVYKMNERYDNFLKEFDYQSTVYQETDDYSTINDGIKINK